MEMTNFPPSSTLNPKGTTSDRENGLTAYEIRLCAYLHLQLSGKEIATLLNIDPPSVRKAKMRLKKKMEVIPS